MTELQARQIATRLLNRASETGGRFAIVCVGDSSCRVLVMRDAELMIKTKRASWSNVVGVYDKWALADDIVDDLRSWQ